MRKKKRFILLLSLIILTLVFAISCSTKQVSTTKDPYESSGQYVTPTGKTGVYQPGSARSDEISEYDSDKGIMTVMLEDIHFEFDKSTLTAKAKNSLMKTAQWLELNSEVSVIIEGHCDNRGTNEYNIALGDRRAASTMSFLVNLGTDPSRLTTISYGEERPLAHGQNETSWAKNRRAHFALE
jgi:peptidoglycan-associated lipoprotein